MCGPSHLNERAALGQTFGLGVQSFQIETFTVWQSWIVRASLPSYVHTIRLVLKTV